MIAANAKTWCQSIVPFPAEATAAVLSPSSAANFSATNFGAHDM